MITEENQQRGGTSPLLSSPLAVQDTCTWARTPTFAASSGNAGDNCGPTPADPSFTSVRTAGTAATMSDILLDDLASCGDAPPSVAGTAAERLNIDEVYVSESDPRLPVLVRRDSFARDVLGILQACEADGTEEERMSHPAVAELSRSMACLFPPRPSLDGTNRSSLTGALVHDADDSEDRHSSASALLGRSTMGRSMILGRTTTSTNGGWSPSVVRSFALAANAAAQQHHQQLTSKPVIDFSDFAVHDADSDTDEQGGGSRSPAQQHDSCGSSMNHGGPASASTSASPPRQRRVLPSAPTIAEEQHVGFAQRLGGDRLQTRRTLREAETEEREEIRSLYSELLLGLKYECVRLLSELGDCEASLQAQREAERQFDALWGHRLSAMIDLHFLRVFPNGVGDTALTPLQAASLVEAYIAAEPLITELDLRTLGFGPAAASSKLPQHTKVATTAASPSSGGGHEASIPLHQRPYYHAYMSAKAALQLLAPRRVGVEGVRDLLTMYFYGDRMDLVAPQERLAVEALAHAAKLSMGRPERSALVERIHRAALTAERRARRSFDDPDNTIAVEYQKGELCGRGTYGRVYRCLNVNSGKFLALKEIPLSGATTEEAEQQIRVEIETLKSLNHPNVIRYFGCRFDRERGIVSIMMDYAPRSLRDVVTECGGLSYPLVAHYGRQVLSGLAYIHSQGIIHLDVKSANSLVTDTGDVRLSDFGCATLVTLPPSQLGGSYGGGVDNSGGIESPHELVPVPTAELLTESSKEERVQLRLRMKMQQQRARTRLVGTPCMLPRELLLGELPSSSTDVYAFGGLLIELVTGKFPWAYELQLLCGDEKPSIEMLLLHISRATTRPQLPPEIDAPIELLDVLDAAMHPDPRARPSAEELLKFPFFTMGSSPIINSSAGGVPPLELQNSTSLPSRFVDTQPTSPLAGGLGPFAGPAAATAAGLRQQQLQMLSAQNHLSPVPPASNSPLELQTNSPMGGNPRRARGASVKGTEVVPPARRRQSDASNTSVPNSARDERNDATDIPQTHEPILPIRRREGSAGTRASPTSQHQQQFLDDTLCTGTIILNRTDSN